MKSEKSVSDYQNIRLVDALCWIFSWFLRCTPSVYLSAGSPNAISASLTNCQHGQEFAHPTCFMVLRALRGSKIRVIDL
jgi:hypothetical protein